MRKTCKSSDVVCLVSGVVSEYKYLKNIFVIEEKLFCKSLCELLLSMIFWQKSFSVHWADAVECRKFKKAEKKPNDNGYTL